jgi:broad specificity phosphatase PhoE
VQLVLIRHAAVQAEADRPASQWALSASGVVAARGLADLPAVGGVAVFASSPERKAVATAVAAARGRPVVEVPGLAELDRSAVGWLGSQDEYVELVRAIFAQPLARVRGCEPAAVAVRRFSGAVDDLRGQHPATRLAVVSHGLVLALYIAELRGQAQASLAEWQRIALPDVAVVDSERAMVVQDFGG